jgi:hypothetical protein
MIKETIVESSFLHNCFSVFKESGYMRKGFTIPFLVGVCREKYSDNRLSLDDVFSALLNSQDSCHLTYCFNLKEIILETGMNPKIKRIFILINGREQNVLSVSPFLEEGGSVEEIINSLTQRHSSEISKSLWSKVGSEWSAFDSNERNLIALASK